MKSHTTQAPQVEAKEIAQEAARRSLVWLVVVLPVAAACWQASQGLSLGTLTLGLTVAGMSLGAGGIASVVGLDLSTLFESFNLGICLQASKVCIPR